MSDAGRTPVVTFVTAEHCAYCAPVWRALKACQEILHFDVRQRDVSQLARDFRHRTNVRGLPTIIFENDHHVAGMVSRSELFQILVRNL